MSAMTPNTLDDIRADLVGAIGRSQHRSRARRRVLAGVTTAAAIVAAPVTVSMSADNGFAVNQALAIASSPEGTVTVRVLDASADPQRMEAELQAAGITVDIDRVPASPSLHGDLVGFESSVERDSAAASEFAETLELEVGGEYWVAVGRAAEGRERYVVAMDPTGPGEPLHCEAPFGGGAGEALEVVQAAGLDATFRIEAFNGSGNGAEGRSTQSNDPPAGAVSGYAWIDSSTVAVFVDPTVAPTAGSSGC